ncbi:MAG: hypothetical protein ACRDV0_06340 [Acidimicrobiales bacterium]
MSEPNNVAGVVTGLVGVAGVVNEEDIVADEGETDDFAGGI